MATWKIAGVQMDCRLGDTPHNLAAVRARLHQAAAQEARLVIFPECVLSGYGFESLAEAQPHAETLSGPAVTALAADCRKLGVWTALGLLEKADGALFNTCALIGPAGVVAAYRKTHLPFLGVDRFTTPGSEPYAVHDLGGLRMGMLICYDVSFPEASRALMLRGADLIVLPTNWPPGARTSPQYLVPARALENHLYFAAVDRVGEERGFRFIGQSRVINPNGEVLAGGGDGEEILYAEVDPAVARQKYLARIPGKYELDRLADRRPELYGPLCDPSLRPAPRTRRLHDAPARETP